MHCPAGSSITGNVVAASTNDTLALGGITNSSFDVSQIGSSAQYQGFGVFQKTGTSTWWCGTEPEPVSMKITPENGRLGGAASSMAGSNIRTWEL